VKSRKLFFVLAGLLFLAGALYAQASDTVTEPTESLSAAEQVPEPEVLPLYRIAGVEYRIAGVTQERILEIYMEIPSGKLFYSEEELFAFIADKTIHLNNQRTFDSGTVTVAEIVKQEEGPDEVFLLVEAKDTWNILVLPYFKYDSNDGLLLSLRGRDYNFLGSMETLSFNLDYTSDPFGEAGKDPQFSFNGNFTMPFALWDRDWDFSLGYNVEYETEQPVYFSLDTGLAYYFPLFDRRWKASVSNNYYLNRRDGDAPPEDHYYFTSGASVGGPISTGLTVGRFPISYSPSISASGSWVALSPISEGRKGITGTFSHSLGWGRIDEKGNFRKGYTFSVSNSNSYNFYKEDPAFSFNTAVQAHTEWGWGGLNSRLHGFFLIDTSKNDAGGPLRGIIDDRIDNVDAGIYANLDLPFNMWIWFMSRWFEGHLSPFFDAAMFRGTDGSFGYDKFWYATGVEGYAFLKRARSIYLRVSFGFDLKAVLEEGANPWDVKEIFIGLARHY
jgi:hypothetical protein